MGSYTSSSSTSSVQCTTYPSSQEGESLSTGVRYSQEVDQKTALYDLRDYPLSKDKNPCCTWKNVALVAGAIFILAGIAGFVGVGLMFSPLVLPTMGLIFNALALTTPLSVGLAAGGALLLGFIFLVARKGCCPTKDREVSQVITRRQQFTEEEGDLDGETDRTLQASREENSNSDRELTKPQISGRTEKSFVSSTVVEQEEDAEFTAPRTKTTFFDSTSS